MASNTTWLERREVPRGGKEVMEVVLSKRHSRSGALKLHIFCSRKIPKSLPLPLLLKDMRSIKSRLFCISESREAQTWCDTEQSLMNGSVPYTGAASTRPTTGGQILAAREKNHKFISFPAAKTLIQRLTNCTRSQK